MKKTGLKSLGVFFILSLLLCVPGCERDKGGETGILEGKITIGPLCPVETDPPLPGCLPTAETYKAYPVFVCTHDGSKKLALINPALDGAFRIELVAGDYLLILDKARPGIGSSNLPLHVEIQPSGETEVSIDIDTGIR
jgi:hypothetical protein